MSFEIGLSDESLLRLGYIHPLGRIQKVLFLLSVLCGFIPMWIFFRSKIVAQHNIPAVILFLSHVAFLVLLWMW
jgi:hypothetical protein